MTIGDLVLLNIYTIWTFFMWVNVIKHKWNKSDDKDAFYGVLWFLWIVASGVIIGFSIYAIINSEIWNYKII